MNPFEAPRPRVPLEFPDWAEILFKPKRFKVPEGGRGSSKSWSVAMALALIGSKETKRILCAREIQKSIKDSVHKLLSDTIERMGLGWFYTITDTTIKGKNGTEFIFTGLRTNITTVKSMEGIDIVWVEEAEKVSKASWEVLIPTIRKAGSEVWVTFNPDLATDATSQMFLSEEAKKRDDMVVIEVNHSDNPYFPEVLQKQMEYDYRVDPDMAAHVWGGKFRTSSAAQIFKGKYCVESFEPHPSWHGPFYGADFGFAADPATLVKMWLNPEVTKLYIEHEAHGIGVPLGRTWEDKQQNLPQLYNTVPGALRWAKDKQTGLIVPASQQFVIRGDCSRPETINHLASFGFNIVGCEKWPGSVEDGIEWLRGLEQIVIHPRCKGTETEARLYSFKVDKVTGDILPIVADKWNHFWDAIRYGLEPAIKLTREQLVEILVQDHAVSPELDDYDMSEFSTW